MTTRDGEPSRPKTGPGQLDLILSHDIANHLSIILGRTDLLLEEADEEELVDHLATIRSQATAASAMLDSVGGVARGGAQAELETIDLGSVLITEVERLDSTYSAAELHVEIGEDLHVHADALLTSVMTNLIENAIEHNDSSPPVVHVIARQVDGSVIATIQDNGPGLPDEVHDQLVGRGLAPPKTGVHIVRNLVEKYGGSIAVDTGANGTMITVTLHGDR